MGLSQIKVDLCAAWGGDRDAALAAWASSFDKERAEGRSDDDVRRVVTGIVHLHHDTPKERLWLEFFVTCPIYIERQLDKYRMTLQYQQFGLEDTPSRLDLVRDFFIGLNRRVPTFSWLVGTLGRFIITQNELSGRYRTIPDRPYEMPKDVSETLRVAETLSPKDAEEYEMGWWSCPYVPPTAEKMAFEYSSTLTEQHRYYAHKLETLKKAQTDGKITNTEYRRARDVIRGVLGMAFMTDMRIICNLNAFEHIMNQRLPGDAQLEGRVAAYRMFKEVERLAVAPTMLSEMVKANGWAPLLAEVEAAIAADAA